MSPLRTIAIAFSSLSFAIVRYFARFARSTSGIERDDVRRAQDADQFLDGVGELVAGL